MRISESRRATLYVTASDLDEAQERATRYLLGGDSSECHVHDTSQGAHNAAYDARRYHFDSFGGRVFVINFEIKEDD